MGFEVQDADAWFQRNAAALVPARCIQDIVTNVIRERGLLSGDRDGASGHRDEAIGKGRPLTVIELGASNGWRLDGLRRIAPAHRYIAVELSGEAVQAGRAAYPEIKFLEASIAAVPRPDACADLIIISFVLHWISREELPGVVAEVDRLLAPGGVLVIADFWPSENRTVAYHHRSGVWSFKTDYSLLWAAGETYALDTVTPFPDAGNGERCAVWMLRKNV